jgi:hypothetical protein
MLRKTAFVLAIGAALSFATPNAVHAGTWDEDEEICVQPTYQTLFEAIRSLFGFGGC